MDPESEQEMEENRLETFEQCSEFWHIDPESLANVDSDTFDQSFKAIEVRPLKELCSEAKKLDFYQRKVVQIGVKHARSLVRARNGKNPIPSPPFIMVDGAAGSGKSATISILKEFTQLIMQRSGDDLNCPHVALCAPTGTAAVNIKGQTLHSAFGFPRGDDHYSLGDEKRDKKRIEFKNLRFLLIDEISMVKSDQLLSA